MTRSEVRTAQAPGLPAGTSWGMTLLLLATAGLAALAAGLLLLPPPAFASLYGDALYPGVSALFSILTSWTVLPLGIALLPIACGIFLWRTLTPRRGQNLARRLVRPLLLAVLLLSLYLVTWGANYRRPPLLQLVGVAPRLVTQVELDAFSSDLLARVRVAAAELDGVPLNAGPAPRTEPNSADTALAAVSVELQRLTLELGWPATVPPRVKLLPPGTLLGSGYAGMLFPFTLEPQVDAGLSSVSRVAVGAHELAHAAGFAGEADADLAALIAGLRATHPLARYATALTLLSRSLDSLSEEQRVFIVENLPLRALSDLSEARERSLRYLDASLAARVTAVYNRLLKGQGIEAGVEAYTQATELATLLALEGLLPPTPPLFPDSGVDDGATPTISRSPDPAGQRLAALGR